MKIMLDTNIYDSIIKTPTMVECLNRLSMAGKVNILYTHVQEREISKISDIKKKAAIEEIVKQKVKTPGGLYGHGYKYGDGATYGNGSTSGISTSDVRTKAGKHKEDSLIAPSAAKYADVFVTRDRRLSKRMQKCSLSCAIWNFTQLREYVFTNSKICKTKG